jgi:SnoaL-like domain
LGDDDRDRVVEQLAARLKRLEDERAILDTLHRYGHAIDYGLEAEFLDCFTEDAVWDVRAASEAVYREQLRVGRQPARRQGREELARFIAHHTRAPDRLHKHLMVDPRISIEGDTANVISYFLRVDANPSDTGANIRTFGRYLDRLLRCPDSRWRLTERIAETDAFTDLW